MGTRAGLDAAEYIKIFALPEIKSRPMTPQTVAISTELKVHVTLMSSESSLFLELRHYATNRKVA
jgi:hypothetical protein